MVEEDRMECKIFGWVLIAWGIISALLGYFGSMLTIHYMGRESPYPPNVDILISLLNGAPYCLVLCVIGFGLLKCRLWAKRLALFLLVPFFTVIQPLRYLYNLGFLSELSTGVLKFLQGINIYRICPVIIPAVFGLFLFRHFGKSDNTIEQDKLKGSLKILLTLVTAFVIGAISELLLGILNAVIFPILPVRVAGVLSVVIFAAAYYLLLSKHVTKRH